MPRSKTRQRRSPAPTKSAKPAKKHSPLWVPTLMFSLLGVGIFVIVGNYFGLMPGEPNNWYLLVGIGEVTAGFIVATAVR